MQEARPLVSCPQSSQHKYCCHPERSLAAFWPNGVEGPAFSSACAKSLTFLIATNFRLTTREQSQSHSLLGRDPQVDATIGERQPFKNFPWDPSTLLLLWNLPNGRDRRNLEHAW